MREGMGVEKGEGSGKEVEGVMFLSMLLGGGK